MPRDQDGQLVSEMATNDRCPYCGTDRKELDEYETHVLSTCDSRPKTRIRE